MKVESSTQVQQTQRTQQLERPKPKDVVQQQQPKPPEAPKNQGSLGRNLDVNA